MKIREEVSGTCKVPVSGRYLQMSTFYMPLSTEECLESLLA